MYSFYDYLEAVTKKDDSFETMGEGLSTGKGKLEKWWWGTNTRELAEKIKTMSDKELEGLSKVKDSEHLQARQIELVKKEIARRNRVNK